ncbi:DUF6962 family protein [Legionella spiritensis]|uniref:DUF6962 family protein n=1 Tax=Legionella spiritensis TaxID=452 RepID=UPI000F6DC423|nr:hypothetical protein [Legionella spiritensis]VEG92471.1 Uncharacterised protein [Legionella spiritensis]
MDAIITNALTNALHALFLLSYFILAFLQWQKGNAKFTGFIVSFFLIVFLLKILGVLVHYLSGNDYVNDLWLAIAMGVVLHNYFLIHAMRIPETLRAITMVFSLFLAGCFIIHDNFIFIALLLIMVYLLAAIYSEKLTRFGFISVITANIIWIILREGSRFILGYEVPIEWRFDNDVYHLLLIIATFIVYLSIQRGDWSYPKN